MTAPFDAAEFREATDSLAKEIARAVRFERDGCDNLATATLAKARDDYRRLCARVRDATFDRVLSEARRRAK